MTDKQNAPENIWFTWDSPEFDGWDTDNIGQVRYVRADLYEERIAVLEEVIEKTAEINSHVSYEHALEEGVLRLRIADAEELAGDQALRIENLEAEAALAGMWEQRATELEALLARAMPLLKLGRDGDALYRELERIGIEPVEADAVQCRLVLE